MSVDHKPPDFSFELFYTTVNAYYRTAAIKTAIELGIFDVVGEDGKTLPEIARSCQASDRGVRILCRFLVSIGFLKTVGELFFLTREMSLYLQRKSAGYLGGSIDFLLAPSVTSAFKDLTETVRTGEPPAPSDLAVGSDQWVTFARAMAPMMSLPSLLLADLVDPGEEGPLEVVDVGSGHGLFGIAIARRHPAANVLFIDWEDVLAVARENAEQAGVHDRAQFRPGDAFEVDFGEHKDVVVLANLLHHFDERACELILNKAYAALRHGGRVLALEFVANEDRVSPPLAATFSMLMLGTTARGETYTYSDLRRMFGNAGFQRVELRPIPPAKERVVVGTKHSAPR